MENISYELLNDLKDKFNKSSEKRVIKNALSKCALTDITHDMESNKRNIHKFDYEIKTSKVCDQQASGRCWIFAGLNILREEVSKKYNIANFELSQNYIAFYDKLEKINYSLESIIKIKDVNITDRLYDYVLNNTVVDGGQWDMFVSLVKKYGVVPKNIMDETYQSSNTKDSNFVITSTLKKFAMQTKKLNNIDEIRKLKDEVFEKLYNFLIMCFGMPVDKFDFEYKDTNGKYHLVENLTPKTFYDQFVGVNLDDYISIINSPTKDKPFYKMFTVNFLGNVYGNKVKYLNLPMNELVDLIKTQIKNDELVWFGSDCSKFGNRIKGIWDDTMYDYSVFDIDFSMTKEEMLDFNQSVMNHAMVISGFSRDKWKIENSWGESRGEKGYFIMSSNWFDNYVYQAVINKKYLNEAQLKAIDQDLIELEPWDPMGTLAHTL